MQRGDRVTEMRPELSVIVPVLDEAQELDELLQNLARQRNIEMEVIVCDGGQDGGEVRPALRQGLRFPVRFIECPKGRGTQMNAGAEAAAAALFLFLHVDSRFDDEDALRHAVDTCRAALDRRGDCRAMGYFGLRFRRADQQSSLAYSFYEAKTRLKLPFCTHGDQGMLIPAQFFSELGRFDDSFPGLAETLLAERARERGELVLLPSILSTSARRFEQEGLRERQTLNAIMAAFAAARFTPFFRRCRDIYPPHAGNRLDLLPLLEQTKQLLGELPLRERLPLWLKIGRFVRDNAWQILFFLDIRRDFLTGQPGGGFFPFFRSWRRYGSPLLDNPAGAIAGVVLTRLWLDRELARLRKAKHSKKPA